MKQRLFYVVFTIVLLTCCIYLFQTSFARSLIAPTPSPVPVPAQGVNLALDDINITASNADAVLAGPASARDDSLLTSWDCEDGAGAWIEADLGRMCRVTAIVVVHPSIWGGTTSEDLGSYEIQSRNNLSEDWSSVGSIQNEADNGYNLVSMGPSRDMRYIRLTVDDPSRGTSNLARIMELQVWGQALEEFPHWPDPRPVEIEAQNRLAELDTRCANHEWERVRDDAQALLNDLNDSGLINENPSLPNWAEYVRAKTLLDLGEAHLELGSIENAFGFWEQAKESRIRVFATVAAVKIAHVVLPQAQVDRAYELLTWAMGTYPKDMWARVELIDYYNWTQQPDYARAVANEIFDRYPEQASIQHVAWAECKLVAVKDESQDNKPPTQTEEEVYRDLWEKYKDGGGPGDTIVAQDVAFRCKNKLMLSALRNRDYAGSIAHGEELLAKFPNKSGGWSALVHDNLARAYASKHQYVEARAHLDILERDFSQTSFANSASKYRAQLNAEEAHYQKLTGNR